MCVPITDARRSVLALPESVREHDDFVVAAADEFVLARQAAFGGADLERREESRRDEYRGEALRIAVAGEIDAAPAVGVPEAADVGERRALRAPVVEIERRHGRVEHSGGAIGGVHLEQLLRVRKWQRSQQHAVDDGEDRGVRADAERERDDGGDRERGRGAELAQRVGEILRSSPR